MSVARFKRIWAQAHEAGGHGGRWWSIETGAGDAEYVLGAEHRKVVAQRDNLAEAAEREIGLLQSARGWLLDAGGSQADDAKVAAAIDRLRVAIAEARE